MYLTMPSGRKFFFSADTFYFPEGLEQRMPKSKLMQSLVSEGPESGGKYNRSMTHEIRSSTGDRGKSRLSLAGDDMNWQQTSMNSAGLIDRINKGKDIHMNLKGKVALSPARRAAWVRPLP